MHNIEYEIKLNESNRPYIELSKDYEDKSEDKFCAIELACYLITKSFNNQSKVLDEYSKRRMEDSLNFLLDIGDMMAEIIFNEMKAMGELDMMLFKNYHIIVNTIEERNSIDKFTVYNNKIYQKKSGLKVLVNDESQIYTFFENENGGYWEEVCKEDINPLHLRRLNYNPDYYTPDESELNVGDDIVIGTYASDCHGSPSIRWTETTIIGLPLCDFYRPYVTCRKLIKK